MTLAEGDPLAQQVPNVSRKCHAAVMIFPLLAWRKPE